MIRLHPNQRQIALAAGLLAAISLCGCQNPQMAASNPFLAPDRVPPPATRVIAPGTAQPYYPGQPLPTSQIAPAAAAVTPIAKSQAEPAPASVVQAAAAQPLAFSNERTVAIPADDQKLRFALPAPPPAEPPRPDAQPVVPQVAAAPVSPWGVIPAAYNEPAVYQAAQTPTSTLDAPGGPWRAPQIPPTNSPVLPAQYVQPQTAPPTAPIAQQPQPAPAAPAMPVELRAVPSQETAPVEPMPVPPPRMRFPSLTAPSTWFTPPPAPGPAANQQLIGYMVPGANGTSQFVPVEQMQSMAAGAVQQPASVASSDGFRPRGSTK